MGNKRARAQCDGSGVGDGAGAGGGVRGRRTSKSKFEVMIFENAVAGQERVDVTILVLACLS